MHCLSDFSDLCSFNIKLVHVINSKVKVTCVTSVKVIKMNIRGICVCDV